MHIFGVVANLLGTHSTRFQIVKKRHSILILVIVGLFGCTERNETVDSGLKKFKIEGVGSAYYIKLSFPETFVSIRDMNEEKQMDTTNAKLNWILDRQYENPDFFCFFDSVDTKLNIFIKTGPRVDISGQERKLTYFTVPTTPLHKIFPAESDKRKIIYDSGEKKYKEKTYYKRTYQINPDSLGFKEYFYLTTKWQSTLVIVNSPRQVDVDKYILDYEVHPKPKDAN